MLHILLEEIIMKMVEGEQKRVLVEHQMGVFIRTVLSSCTTQSHGCLGVMVRLATHFNKDTALTDTDALWSEFTQVTLDKALLRQNQVLGETKSGQEEQEQETPLQDYLSNNYWRPLPPTDEDQLTALMRDL